jgi:hypothetical protein
MAYEDLLKDTSRVDSSNSNYFLVTITDLDVNQSYPIQFRWKYNDGTFSPWSAVRVVTTPGESDPNTPKFADSNVDVTTPGFIKITWDGTSDDATPTPLTDIDRVDVYIDGLPFDGNKPAATFKTAGTQVIAAPGGTYQIVLYAVSKLGKLSPVSAAVTKTVSDISNPVVDPEDPEAPTVTAGLASVIVEWSGKKSGGGDFPTGSFAGAKVFIGTSAGFTPSDNNWVHTLNFANGSNKVSIGVGTVIDKAAGTLLQYNTPYFIKIDTINASGTSNNNPIAASGNPITVNKVAASEIITGTLAADASITAGIDGGSRVVLSGGANPLVIYGTNGTTELLKFTGGATGTLTVNGGGTFTGDLSAGSGSSIFKSDSSGIYLGNAVFALAPFSVSRNGILKAESGTIGGWTLGSTFLQNAGSSPTIKIDTSGIIVGSTSNAYIDITSSGITHRNSNGTASGKFTLTTGPSAQLTIDGTFTISGTSTINGTAASTVVSNASTGSTAIQSGNGVDKNSSNQITRISTNGGIVVSSSTASSGARVELTNTGFYAYNGSGQPTVSINAADGSASFTGTINANSGYLGSASSGWNITSTSINNNASTYAGVTSIFAQTSAGYSILVPGIINADNGYQANLGVRLFTGGSTTANSFWKSQGNMSPNNGSAGSTGLYSVGSSSWKWSQIWADTGTIQTSDERLKKNISNSNLGLNFINLLNPISYKWKIGGGIPIYDEESGFVIGSEPIPGERTHYGFLAQEIKQALDQVSPGQDFGGWVLADKNDPDSTQSLRYEEFISPIVKAIQELSARLDALES